MDLLSASSLLSPLSRVLIHTETQFHLTEPIFLPVLIYGPDHDLRELKGGGGREEAGRLGGPLRRGESGGGSSSGPLSTACLLGRAERLSSSWEKPSRRSLLSWSSQTPWPVLRNNNSNQKRTEGWPSRVYIVP